MEPQEPRVRPLGPADEPAAERAPDPEQQEVEAEHVGERVGVRPHHRVDDAEEHDLEAEGDGAGEPVQQVPRPCTPRRVGRPHRSDGVPVGFWSRFGRLGRQREQREGGEGGGGEVAGGGEADGADEAEGAEQEPAGHGGAGSGAEGVDGVEATDQRTDVGIPPHEAPAQERERQPHQRRRHDEEGGVEGERGEGAADRRFDILVEVVEQRGTGDGERGDGGVGDGEGDHAATRSEAIGEAAAEEAADAEPAEERSDDGGGGVEVDAAVQGDHPLPHDLQGQGGEPGEGEDEGEQDASGGPGRRRGRRRRHGLGSVGAAGGPSVQTRAMLAKRV